GFQIIGDSIIISQMRTLMIILNGLKKSSFSQNPFHHSYDIAAFSIGKSSVENSADSSQLCIRNIRASTRKIRNIVLLTFQIVHKLTVVHQEFFVGQMFAESRKTFVKPNVIPRSASHFVPEPLMRQLMCDHIFSPGTHGRHGLMLHTNAVVPEFHVSVFFIPERIFPKISFK